MPLWRRRRHPTTVASRGQAADPAVELEDDAFDGDAEVDEPDDEDDPDEDDEDDEDELSEDDPVEDGVEPPVLPDESEEAAAGAGVPAGSPPVLPLRESVR
jgi:hypothetical protein